MLVQGAPFLSARATPRLDRKRTRWCRLSCDQDCSIAVRLTAPLRSQATFTRAAGQALDRGRRQRAALRLRLPTKPRGTLKTVWITGPVRNAAGDVRTREAAGQAAALTIVVQQRVDLARASCAGSAA